MKHLSLIVLLFLVGCDKHRRFLGTTSPSGPTNLLIMGQSNAVRFSPDGVVGLSTLVPLKNVVNCAVGSTRIDAWQEGQPYYNTCLSQMPVPDVVFFWQGENDTWDGTNWTSWGAQFTALCAALKRVNPSIKIVYAQLGANNSGYVYNRWATLQAIQASIRLPRVYMITTLDLATEPADGIHMLPESEYSVGLRVGQALIN